MQYVKRSIRVSNARLYEAEIVEDTRAETGQARGAHPAPLRAPHPAPLRTVAPLWDVTAKRDAATQR
jgi:hypothetical protein